MYGERFQAAHSTTPSKEHLQKRRAAFWLSYVGAVPRAKSALGLDCSKQQWGLDGGKDWWRRHAHKLPAAYNALMARFEAIIRLTSRGKASTGTTSAFSHGVAPGHRVYYYILASPGADRPACPDPLTEQTTLVRLAGPRSRCSRT